jgi:hypothetical protein
MSGLVIRLGLYIYLTNPLQSPIRPSFPRLNQLLSKAGRWRTTRQDLILKMVLKQRSNHARARPKILQQRPSAFISCKWEEAYEVKGDKEEAENVYDAAIQRFPSFSRQRSSQSIQFVRTPRSVLGRRHDRYGYFTREGEGYSSFTETRIYPVPTTTVPLQTYSTQRLGCLDKFLHEECARGYGEGHQMKRGVSSRRQLFLLLDGRYIARILVHCTSPIQEGD